MVLIKSISGIRGTIGGKPGETLSPLDIVMFTAAFATLLQKKSSGKKLKLVIGRDARVSGKMVNDIVIGTLSGKGVDVIDLGLSTTPTVEIAIIELAADGGIMISASHNPENWNALKLFNNLGEFISARDGEDVLYLAEKRDFHFATVDNIGCCEKYETAIKLHIDKILDLPLVNTEAIQKAGFSIAVDCVNSTGGISVAPLLKALGVRDIIELYTEPTGHFPHNPEPLPENLNEIADSVVKNNADVGFVVDPDVDRLAIVTNEGKMFGEEYTLVAVADYILQHKPGNTVSNLSSTRALRDITMKHGGKYYASAVGEVNVVDMMKTHNAVIGGEGNGGVIYPELHYGRDALAGIALFLSYLAISGKSCADLRKNYPDYFISKKKIELSPGINVDQLLKKIQEQYKDYQVNTIDGLKIEFDEGWVHLRKSNTEPVLRIYSENVSLEKSNILANKLINSVHSLIEH
jgi:phosphomannomutase